MIKVFRKIQSKPRSKVDLVIQAEIARVKVSNSLSKRIMSLRNAVAQKNTDKVSKYIREIKTILEKKYTKLEARIEKLHAKYLKKIAAKELKAAKAVKAAKKAAAEKAKAEKAKAKKTEAKKAKKSSKPKKATKSRKSKDISVPAAYRLFGGFNDLEDMSDLDLS
jgi:septal ring factor EnvC (AmiA/AmiB activator)